MEETVKFEIPQIQLSGKYKIQLFDKDTNELVEEVEKHNVISKIPFSTAFYNHIYRGFICNDNCSGMIATNINSNNGWYRGYINWLLLISDSEGIEGDNKNPVILGDMIGYARYADNNSSADVKKGIFNQNETTTIYNRYEGGTKIKSVTKHIVWDFGTDKGNGTFDNIYLAPNPDDNYNPEDYRGQYVNISSIILSNSEDYTDNRDKNNNGDLGPLSSSDTNLYMQCLYYKNLNNWREQHWDKIAKLSFSEWKKEYITLNVPDERKSIPAYIIYACGMFWRIEPTYMVTRYNLDGTYKDTINLKSKFTNNNIIDLRNGRYNGSPYIGSDNGLDGADYYDFFTGDDNYLYIGYINKKNTDYEYILCSIDNKGTIVSEILVNTDKSYRTCAKANLVYINGKSYIISPGNEYRRKAVFLVDNGKLIKKNSVILNYLSREGYLPFFYSKDGLLFRLGSGSSYYNKNDSLYVGTLIPWSSHCKLSSPVTKTSTNTMKIQYDVTVDYIMPGMIENLK